MIVKTISGKSFKGCVSYLHDKVLKGNGEILHSKDVTTDNVKYAVKEMVEQARTYNDPRFSGRCVWHTSISFAKGDRVDNELMRTIAQEYIQKNALDKSQCLVIRHTDTEHQHFHILANRVNSESKLVSDSFTKTRDYQFARDIEKKYNLDVAKSKNLDKIRLDNFKNKADQQKISLYKEVKSAIENSYSIDNLKENLGKKGIQLNERGKEFVFTMEQPGIDSKPYKFRGSTIDKELEKENIIEKIQQQQRELEEKSQYPKRNL